MGTQAAVTAGRWRRKLTGALLLPIGCVLPAAAADRVALVIGNGAYKAIAPLANPGNDAADMAAALRRIGFDVVEGRDLDKRGMEAMIIAFSRKLGSTSCSSTPAATTRSPARWRAPWGHGRRQWARASPASRVASAH